MIASSRAMAYFHQSGKQHNAICSHVFCHALRIARCTSHAARRSDLIRLSSAASPPPDPDAPGKEPKFSLMHEYTWILPPSSPAAASPSAAAGVFEFWGPAASPHRLSIVCAADGSARVRACIRSANISCTTPSPLPPSSAPFLFPQRQLLAISSLSKMLLLPHPPLTHPLLYPLSAAATLRPAPCLLLKMMPLLTRWTPPSATSVPKSNQLSAARGARRLAARTCTCRRCRTFHRSRCALPPRSPARVLNICCRYGGGCTSLFGDAAEGQGGALPGVELLNYSQAAVCLASQLSRVMPNVKGSM